MPAKKVQPAIPHDRLALYDQLIATNPAIERKGVSLPYTSANGHMFTFLAADGTLAIRLPPGEREAFLKKHKTTLMQAHGTVMAEYVAVPAALLAKTKMLQPYLELSYAYVQTLRPKTQKPLKTSAKKK
jgi:hypothetical protein